MKTFAIALFACCLALSVSGRARADDAPRKTYVTLEEQTVFAGGEIVPDINGTIVRYLYGPVGLYSFFYVDRDYADALLGLAVAPTKWMVVTAGAGLEHAEEGSWRVGGMLWMGQKRWTSVTFLETGASGFWGRTEFTWRPAPWAGIGILADLSLGVGPRLELNIPHLPFQVWGASLYDWQDDRPAAALGVRFDL